MPLPATSLRCCPPCRGALRACPFPGAPRRRVTLRATQGRPAHVRGQWERRGPRCRGSKPCHPSRRNLQLHCCCCCFRPSSSGIAFLPAAVLLFPSGCPPLRAHVVEARTGPYPAELQTRNARPRRHRKFLLFLSFSRGLNYGAGGAAAACGLRADQLQRASFAFRPGFCGTGFPESSRHSALCADGAVASGERGRSNEANHSNLGNFSALETSTVLQSLFIML